MGEIQCTAPQVPSYDGNSCVGPDDPAQCGPYEILSGQRCTECEIEKVPSSDRKSCEPPKDSFQCLPGRIFSQGTKGQAGAPDVPNKCTCASTEHPSQDNMRCLSDIYVGGQVDGTFPSFSRPINTLGLPGPARTGFRTKLALGSMSKGIGPFTASFGMEWYTDERNPPIDHRVYEMGLGLRVLRVLGRSTLSAGFQLDVDLANLRWDRVGANPLGVPETVFSVGPEVTGSLRFGSTNFGTSDDWRLSVLLSGAARVPYGLGGTIDTRIFLSLAGEYGAFEDLKSPGSHWIQRMTVGLGVVALEVPFLQVGAMGAGLRDNPSLAGRAPLLEMGLGTSIAGAQNLLLSSVNDKRTLAAAYAFLGIVAIGEGSFGGAQVSSNPHVNDALRMAAGKNGAMAGVNLTSILLGGVQIDEKNQLPSETILRLITALGVTSICLTKEMLGGHDPAAVGCQTGATGSLLTFRY